MPWCCRPLLLACAVLLAVACSHDWDAFLPPDPQGGPPGPWQSTFQEECDGAGPLPARWNTHFVSPNRSSIFRRYDWNQAWVVDENVSYDDGLCRLKVENRQAGDGMYASATLDSTNKFEQRHGYFEVRLRAARGQGLSSVVTLASGDDWPPQVNFAAVTGGDTGEARFTAYWRESSGSDAENEGIGYDTVDLSREFHVYGVQWVEDRLRFFLDGDEVAAIDQATPFLTVPMRLQATVHVATEFGPAPDATTMFPAHLDIDWIRVWKRP